MCEHWWQGSPRASCVLVLAGAAPLYAGPPSIAPFTEESVRRGLVYVMQGWPVVSGYSGFGCGFADLDGDGDPDVVLLGAANGRVGLFENDGTGHFIDRTAGSGLPVLPQASALALADYDGDGLVDLYLTQWELPNVLAHNEGGFRFTDRSVAAGVDNASSSKGACWADFDGDMLLDLYVCNYATLVLPTPNALYRNLGTGAFEEVAVAQGVDDLGLSFEAVWTDYDLDGDVDLYLSNDKGYQPPLFIPNQLWRNDGGQMVNVSMGSGADIGLNSMGLACGDFDGNGWPDFYLTNDGPGAGGYNNPLLLNDGLGAFVESSSPAGVGNPILSWGSIFMDYDNNGHMDLYVNNMFVDNTLYANSGVFPTVEVAQQAQVVATGGISYSSAVADVDDDGDLDLLVNNLSGNVQLFINHEGELRNWIKYRMVGQGANTGAVGGNVKTRTGSTWQLREVLAGGNNYLGQNELTIHVGLDAASMVDEVLVSWPGGATTRTLVNLPANETWTLYPPERLGDADGDGLVDFGDFCVFSDCYDGGFAAGCEMMDFDGSSAIDLDDFDAFLAVYSQPLYDCDANGVLDLMDMLLDPGVDLDGSGVPDTCEAQGDLDGDGLVGILDLLAMLATWGACTDCGACPADMDGDCAVGITDFLALLGNWG